MLQKLTASVIILALPVLGFTAEFELLPGERAFQVSARSVAQDTVEVTFNTAPGYRVYLERLRFSVEPPSRGQVVSVATTQPTYLFVEGEGRNVPFLIGQGIARVVVKNTGGKPFTLKTRGQGCAAVGLCYPPFERQFNLP